MDERCAVSMKEIKDAITVVDGYHKGKWDVIDEIIDKIFVK